MMNKESLYFYKAKITRIIDGDTIEAEVDLGFHIQANLRFRLADIDTPELRIKDQYEDALKAKKYLEDNILGGEYIIASYKCDKYGRWLAIIYLDDGTTINNRLLEECLAKEYKG